MNELKNTARTQEQKIATQQTEIQKLRELIQKLERGQISQQQESSRLKQQVDREIHHAESLPEGGLEREPQSCLDLPHDLHKHNETGPIPGGDYSSLVEEVARRSRDQRRRQALQEENRKDFRQRALTPMATSSPAREATEPESELSQNMKVLGESVKQLVDLQQRNSQGTSPRCSPTPSYDRVFC